MTCAPCKILFGNYYEGLELGADQLVLFGGPDTCRLGYMARPQAERLRNAGFRFTPHTLSLRGMAADIVRVARELADPSPLELVEAARTLLASLALVDEIEQQALRLRPREQERGTATRLRAEALVAVRACQDLADLHARCEAILTTLRTAPRDNERQVFRVALLGDVYSIYEPFLNMNLDQRLDHMGVEVERWFWLSKSLRFPVLERVRRHSETQARGEEKENLMRIGLPRALSYYEYGPIWRTFFDALGADVIVSGPATHATLEIATSRAAADLCFPVRVYVDHLLGLADQVDLLFVPSLRRPMPAATHCAKIVGLPDLARAVVPDPSKLFEVDLNLDKGRLALAQAVWAAGRPLTWNPIQIARAAEAAWETCQESQKPLAAGRSVQIHSSEVYWAYAPSLLGAGLCFLEMEAVDGLVAVIAFGCAPDSGLAPVLGQVARQATVPMLTLTLDEHSG